MIIDLFNFIRFIILFFCRNASVFSVFFLFFGCKCGCRQIRCVYQIGARVRLPSVSDEFRIFDFRSRQLYLITGNFCLLTGIDPDEVDAWYLGVYIDALEWVEMPNTRGMSQFADGGIVGSKAYAASGNYVKKMSDYCGSCHYQVAKTTEADACPLNSLYWRFIHQQQQLLGNNPRNAMVYANWQKKTAEQQQAILTRAELYLNAIEQL